MSRAQGCAGATGRGATGKTGTAKEEFSPSAPASRAFRNATASRRLCPVVFICQSITEPLAPQPKQ
ncbi:hypothetical protein D3C81_1748020 [compost metagenome]